jgi:hypothetical protein
MADVTVRPRGDGVVQILPNTQPLEDDERYLAMFGVLFAAAGLFVSAALPAQAVAVAAACCASSELSLRLRQRALRRRPAAEVHLLPRRRRR